MSEKIRYIFTKARSGETVPAIVLPSGETKNLHSMIDPKREAHRLVSAITEDIGFFIFLGLGGGFAPQAALETTNARIIVIDFDKDGIQDLLASGNYTRLLNNDRFSLLIDPSCEVIKNIILENYKPALMGGIKTIPLRSRTEQNTEEFEKAFGAIQEAIEITGSDYSVQAYFGIRWFSNIIRNIKNINKNNNVFFENKKQIRDAAIIAAGPSLDHQLTSLKDAKEKGFFIISSDTALPALLHNGIEADAVVSIDCQHISYYHFLGCNLRCIPLILDIASPPSFTELSHSPVFFSSGHPLSVYICEYWRPFTRLDTSGGNVTYACLSLAETLGMRNIILYGADFSYINSSSYARGTYLNPYFSKRQNRLSPLEAQSSAFLYRNPFLLPEDNEELTTDKSRYYETSSLRFYRKKLEEKTSMMTARVTCERGSGAPVIIRSRERIVYRNENRIEEKSSSEISGMEFLEQYRNDIAALPGMKNNEYYLSVLNKKESQIFTTLLPFAAAIKKQNTVLKQKDLIEEVKIQSIKKIEKVLNSVCPQSRLLCGQTLHFLA
ncbi:MAG: DUF115 domain-containing protein [Treponema sp.]|nr:DUF115 domain-containing protein [Treponema sp.]